MEKVKLTSAGYEHIGKAFITVGQGMILATLVSMLLTNRSLSLLLGLMGVGIGVVLLYVGIWYIEKSTQMKKEELKEK